MDTFIAIAEKVATFGGGWALKAVWERYTKREDRREERKDSLDDTLRSTAKELVEELTKDLREEVRTLRQELREEQKKGMECEQRASILSARVTILEATIKQLSP